jgi:hypothetical protein
VTDFASVPRIFTWLLPRYGLYTRAAILHDHLCELARAGGIARSDADGIFRRANRELGVAFLRRWLMWAAVRVDAARRFGLAELGRGGPWELPRFLAVALPGVLFVLVPGLVILLALGLFLAAEWLAYPVLRAGRARAARRRAVPPKEVNAPSLTWRL